MQLTVTVDFTTGVWMDPGDLWLDVVAREAFRTELSSAPWLTAKAPVEHRLVYEAALGTGSQSPGRVRFDLTLHETETTRTVVAAILEASPVPLTTVLVREARIRPHGVGSILVDVVPADPTSISRASLTTLIDLVSSSSAPIVRDLVEHLRACCRACAIRRQSFPSQAESAGVLDGPPATPLFGHGVLVIDDVSSVAATAAAVLPSSYVVVDQGQTVAAPGLHATVLASADPDARDLLIDTMDEIHAWWTITWCWDRELLVAATRIALDSRTSSPSALGAQAQAAATLATDIRTTLSQLRSHQINLGGTDSPVWDATATLWALSSNLDAVERKTQDLQMLAERLRATVLARQATRINRTAALFTMITVIASIVAIWLFLAPSKADDSYPVLERLAVVGFGFALAISTLYWAEKAVAAGVERRRAAREARIA